jgi:alcohol dehydrogenase/L-iditol 2-dehydrogenase
LRAIVNFEGRPHAVELLERAVPEIGPGDVLLRVRGVGVCGSDLHQWHASHSWNVNYPVVLGHEFGGEIAAVGKEVTGWKEGDRVVSETAASICGACAYCRGGMYNLCPNRLGFGYGTDGAMADYVRVPARCLHRVPDGLAFEDAAMTEPGCVAANAVLELSTVKPGDFVVVLGPGTIGLMCLQMAALGSPDELWMLGTRRDEARLQTARQLGATRTVFVEEEDAVAAVQGHGDGFGADLVVDCTGVSQVISDCMRMVRPAGQITKVGWGRDPVGVSLDPLVAKAARLQGSFSHTWKTWERVLALYASGKVQTAPVRRVFPLDAWHEAFETMDSLAVAKSVLVP